MRAGQPPNDNTSRTKYRI